MPQNLGISVGFRLDYRFGVAIDVFDVEFGVSFRCLFDSVVYVCPLGVTSECVEEAFYP